MSESSTRGARARGQLLALVLGGLVLGLLVALAVVNWLENAG